MDKLPFRIGDVPIQRNFDQVKKAIDLNAGAIAVLNALGLTKRARGTVGVSTSAAVFGTATVTHGLGATPTVVNATCIDSSNGVVNVTVSSIGATQFTVAVRFTDDVARTTTVTVGWEAIA